MVANRQGLEGWGKGLLRRLAVDLKDELPEIKGFSERNLQLMIQFQREYPDLFTIPQPPVAELPDTSLPGKIRPQPAAEFKTNDSTPSAQGTEKTLIAQQVVAQLPWAHNVILIQKLKDLPPAFGMPARRSPRGGFHVSFNTRGDKEHITNCDMFRNQACAECECFYRTGRCFLKLGRAPFTFHLQPLSVLALAKADSTPVRPPAGKPQADLT